jgi:hypothetical protein
MSIYPSPTLRDGVLNSVFNSADYVRDTGGGGGLTFAQTDTRYLKNSGIVVSSANTTFNGTVDIGALCTVDNINVTTSLDTATVNITGLCSADSLNVTTSLDTATANVSGLCSADSLNVTTSLDTATANVSGLCSADSLNVTTSLDTATANVSGLCTADSLKATTSVDTATITATGLCTADSLNVTTSLDTATANVSGLCTADSLNVTTSLDTATITATGLCTADSLNVTTSLEAGTITAPLATIDTLTVSTLNVKNLSDTLTADFWRNDQVYSFSNGLVYSLISDDAVVNSVSFINIPTTINQSYIFTFIIQPSVANSPYYIRTSTNNVSVNGVSIPLYGLQNASLAGNYTYLVQQISIIYNLYATDPQFIALTSVSSY